MNKTRLKEAARTFLAKYPGGFKHPDLVAIGKKHKMDKMIELTQERFAKSRFRNADDILDAFSKTISSSSMISMFEKPKFRDFIASADAADQAEIVRSLKQLLHGKASHKGFTSLIDVLAKGKMAKWTVATAIPVYFRPNDEIFVKPSTTKGVIEHFELDLTYRPRPTWEFYSAYREAILKMKKAVSKTLSPNNAAFTGFLMSSLRPKS